jgi:NAD(P)-dependent dehydrogenase (short-subunit alcohol dehydrogenase family)
MRLKDKVAIVTGGAHGMGEAQARLFASEGAKVVVADILGNEAEAVAAHIRAGDGEAIAATIDVTSEPAWVELIAKTLASYGRLDVLHFEYGSRAGWWRIMEVLGQHCLGVGPLLGDSVEVMGVLLDRGLNRRQLPFR